MYEFEYNHQDLTTITSNLRKQRRCQLPKRYLMIIFAITMMIICFCQRNTFYFSYQHIVPLNYTQNTGCKGFSSETLKVYLKEDNAKKETILSSFKLNWTMYDERYIHSGFFAGYLVMQLPVGYLCDVFGPKPFLIAGMAISSVATAIVPIMFKHSDFINLILTNGFMGVGQAVLYPGLTCLLVQWIPYQERSTGGALVFDMYGFGSVFCCLVTIVFMNHVENWMYIFYMWVIIGVIWCLLFSAFGSSGPFENDFISLRERDFLEKNLDIKAYYIQTPVTAILMDINIWAVILTNTASEMIIALQIITIPEYLNLVFRLPPYYEMILSKFPLVLITVSGMISGIISDFVISRKRCKPICVRIIMCFFGILAPSLVLLLAFHMLCNMKNFLILYTLSALLIGTYFNASILDISVNHAGFIMGLANSIGVFFSMFFCYTVKDLARTYNLEEWRSFLLMTSYICAASLIVFSIFARGYRAKWDYAPYEEPKVPKHFSWSCFFGKNRNAH